MKAYSVTALTLALLLVAGPAYALTIDAGAGASGKAKTDAGSADTSVEVRANVGAGTSTDDDEGAENGNGTSTEARAEGGAGIGVSLEARDIRGMSGEQKAEFLTTVRTHAEVQSGQDLENFAKGVLAADANVDAVATTENEVRLTYRVPARFLGIFETSIPATVLVRAKGSADATERVRARLPWYSFLFGVSAEATSEQLTSVAAAEVASEVSGTQRFDAQTQARIIAKLQAALQAQAEAAAEAEADVEAEVE